MYIVKTRELIYQSLFLYLRSPASASFPTNAILPLITGSLNQNALHSMTKVLDESQQICGEQEQEH